MSLFSRKRPTSSPSEATNASPDIRSYLTRLYVESRQILFRILLGESLPPTEPFPTDPSQTTEILHRIETLIASDEHLDRCRGNIGVQFPGRLAVMFNLANKEDQLFPNDRLRESIQNHVCCHQGVCAGQPLDGEDLKVIDELKRSSKLQQQLAYLVNYTPNKWLLEQEIPVVLESRKRRIRVPRSQPSGGATDNAGSSSAEPTSKHSGGFSHKDDPFAWSRDTGRLSGLCLSGGGIRSATFNLGILQGLAYKNLLRSFDYCSSVSGGGYIHQWFAAWVKREEAMQPVGSGSPGLDAVCRQLIPLPNPGCSPQGPEPIRWLRRYSNYLTPQTGLLSADTWVTFAIWIRNTFLNQIILVSLLVSVLLIPHLFLLPSPHLPKIADSPSTTSVGNSSFKIAIAVALIVLVSFTYFLLLRSLVCGLKDAREGQACNSRLSDKSLCWSVVLPCLIIAIVVSDFGFYFVPFGLNEYWHTVTLGLLSFLALLFLTFAVTKAGGAMDVRPGAGGRRRAHRLVGFTLAAVFASLAGTGAILLARNTFVTGNPLRFSARSAKPAESAIPKVNVKVYTGDSQQVSVSVQVVKVAAVSMTARTAPSGEMELKWRLVVVCGPLVVTMVPFLAIILQCGLIGYDFQDWVLEWLARVRAWVAMYSLTWTILVGIALFGHQLIDWLIKTGNGWINWTAWELGC
jgi:hypothetical protein